MAEEYQPQWGAQPGPTMHTGAYGPPPKTPPTKKRNPLLYFLIPIGACLGLTLPLTVVGAILGTSEEDEPAAQVLLQHTWGPSNSSTRVFTIVRSCDIARG